MSLDSPRVVEANFKAFTDEYNPTIVVSLEDTADFDITRYNYCKLVVTNADSDVLDWKERNKYYYITSSRSIGKNLYEFTLELDVLRTYKVELSKTEHFYRMCYNLGSNFDFNVIEHQYIFGLGNNPKVVSKEDIEELIYNSHFENGVESVDSVSIRR